MLHLAPGLWGGNVFSNSLVYVCNYLLATNSEVYAPTVFMSRQSFVTEHLQLDAIEESDSLFMFELLNTEGWIEFIGDRNVTSELQAKEYIRRLKASPSIEYFVVTIRSGGRPIGIVSFVKRDYLEAHDLGFAFLPEFAGRGFAFEAAYTILRAKVSQGHRLILATTLPNNARSISLLLKLGFSFERHGDNGKDKIRIYRIADDTILSDGDSIKQ
jgi:[ribosomal protein S5]-alanine N-acetyltransferase